MIDSYKIPTGKGLFLWQIEKCEGGNAKAIANKAVDLGLSWIALKIADGHVPFGNKEKNKEVIREVRAKGIGVHGWQYAYVTYSPRAEAEVAVSLMKEYDLDSFLIDPEAEAKTATDAEVNIYCETLRKGLPNTPIGLCSYRYPSLHLELNWVTFAGISDYHCPQVYWIGSHNPAFQLQKSYNELMKIRHLPFVPAGAAFPHGSWKPTAADIREFDAKAKELGCLGVIYWDWQHASEWFPVIKETKWNTPTQPPPVFPSLPEIPGDVDVEELTNREFFLYMLELFPDGLPEGFTFKYSGEQEVVTVVDIPDVKPPAIPSNPTEPLPQYPMLKKGMWRKYRLKKGTTGDGALVHAYVGSPGYAKPTGNEAHVWMIPSTAEFIERIPHENLWANEAELYNLLRDWIILPMPQNILFWENMVHYPDGASGLTKDGRAVIGVDSMGNPTKGVPFLAIRRNPEVVEMIGEGYTP